MLTRLTFHNVTYVNNMCHVTHISISVFDMTTSICMYVINLHLYEYIICKNINSIHFYSLKGQGHKPEQNLLYWVYKIIDNTTIITMKQYKLLSLIRMCNFSSEKFILKVSKLWYYIIIHCINEAAAISYMYFELRLTKIS